MAATNNPQQQTEIESVALTLFANKAHGIPAGRESMADRAATAAFIQAEAFLRVRARHRAGEVKVASAGKGPRLNDMSCPNLPRTHVHNLVSSVYGDLERVSTIHKWLVANPTPESGDMRQFVMKFNNAHKGLGWDLESIDLARIVFPAYVA